MSDPISIASFAASAAIHSFKAVRAIALFKSQVAGIDQSIESLHFQVDGISVVLSALSDELNEPEFKSQTATINQSLIRHLPKAIQQCDTTLVLVGERIDKLNPPKKKRSIAKQTWRTVKLQWSEPEITELLTRVKGHSMNLQLALMTVSLHNSVHKKSVSAIEQSERFDKLEQMLVAIHERLDQAATTSGNVHQPLSQVAVDDCTTGLVESATSVVSSASTAAGRSISGITTLSNGHPAFDYICESALTHQHVEESTTGSELGSPQNLDDLNQLTTWLHQSSMGAGFESNVEPPRTSTRASGSRDDSGVVLADDSQFQELTSLGHSSDDEDDVDFAVVRKLFSEARQLASAGDCKAVNTSLSHAFKLARVLSSRKGLKLQYQEVKMLFGACKIQIMEEDAAEELFLEVAQLPLGYPVSPKTKLYAHLSLAMLNFEKGKLDYAENVCRQTLKNIAKLSGLGKSHQSYTLSLLLLSLVTLAKGEPHQAKNYLELLPELSRAACIQELNYASVDPRLRQLYPAMVLSLAELRNPCFVLWNPDMEEEEPPEGIERHVYVEGHATQSLSVASLDSTASGESGQQMTTVAWAGLSKYTGSTERSLSTFLWRLVSTTIFGEAKESSSAELVPYTNQKSREAPSTQFIARRPVDFPNKVQLPKPSLGPIETPQVTRKNFIDPVSSHFQSFATHFETFRARWWNLIQIKAELYRDLKYVKSITTYKIETEDSVNEITLWITDLPLSGDGMQWRLRQCMDPLEHKFSLLLGTNSFKLTYSGRTCKCLISRNPNQRMKKNGWEVVPLSTKIYPHDELHVYSRNCFTELSIKVSQVQLARDREGGFRIENIRAVPEEEFSARQGQILLSELEQSWKQD